MQQRKNTELNAHALLPTLSSAEEIRNSSVSESGEKEHLIEREEVPGTPFTLININNEGWFLTMGKYRLIDKGKTKAELLEAIQHKNWELITSVITIVFHTIEQNDGMIDQLVEKVKTVIDQHDQNIKTDELTSFAGGQAGKPA